MHLILLTLSFLYLVTTKHYIVKTGNGDATAKIQNEFEEQILGKQDHTVMKGVAANKDFHKCKTEYDCYKAGKMCHNENAECECINGFCKVIGPPQVAGKWNDWVPWSACHSGTRARFRECNIGGRCTGKSFQEEEEPCPQVNGPPQVAGKWNDWVSWSACHTGTRARFRECNIGGRCKGKSFQEEEEPCPQVKTGDGDATAKIQNEFEEQILGEQDHTVIKGFSGCPSGWSQLSTGCYFVKESPMNWKEAKKFCSELQADMVMIENEAERQEIYDLLRDLLKSRKLRFWLGVRNIDGVWKQDGGWNKGKKFTLTHKIYGHGIGDCLQVGKNKLYKFPCRKANMPWGISFNPFCKKSLRAKGMPCKYKGKTYRHGAQMPCGDGCNLGYCRNGQPGACFTEMHCTANEECKTENDCYKAGKKCHREKPGDCECINEFCIKSSACPSAQPRMFQRCSSKESGLRCEYEPFICCGKIEAGSLSKCDGNYWTTTFSAFDCACSDPDPLWEKVIKNMKKGKISEDKDGTD